MTFLSQCYLPLLGLSEAVLSLPRAGGIWGLRQKGTAASVCVTGPIECAAVAWGLPAAACPLRAQTCPSKTGHSDRTHWQTGKCGPGPGLLFPSALLLHPTGRTFGGGARRRHSLISQIGQPAEWKGPERSGDFCPQRAVRLPPARLRSPR